MEGGSAAIGRSAKNVGSVAYFSCHCTRALIPLRSCAIRSTAASHAPWPAATHSASRRALRSWAMELPPGFLLALHRILRSWLLGVPRAASVPLLSASGTCWECRAAAVLSMPAFALLLHRRRGILLATALPAPRTPPQAPGPARCVAARAAAAAVEEGEEEEESWGPWRPLPSERRGGPFTGTAASRSS